MSRAIEEMIGDGELTEDTAGPHDALADYLRSRDRKGAVTSVRTHLDSTQAVLARLVT